MTYFGIMNDKLYNFPMKKLPLGITTFSDIRDKAQNYLYIDKTEFAW